MTSDDTRFLYGVIRQYAADVANHLAAIKDPDSPLHRTYGPETLALWCTQAGAMCYSAARTIASDYSRPYRSRRLNDQDATGMIAVGPSERAATLADRSTS